LVIGGAVLGAVFLVVILLLLYAASNLDSIIERNREYILVQASNALGRQVQVRQIKATIGFGVVMDLVGVKVGDDPQFSQRDFLTADNVYAKVEFVPLLVSEVRATELVVRNPSVRVIRSRDGVLNVSTIGSGEKEAGNAAPKPPAAERPKGPAEPSIASGQEAAAEPLSALAMLSITRVTIDDGTIEYVDEQAGGEPVMFRDIDLKLRELSIATPFDLDLTLAAFGDTPNVELSGTVGPAVAGGKLDFRQAPLKLDVSFGPAELSQLRTVPMVAAAIPADLRVTGPLAMDGKVSGTVAAPQFHFDLDFTDNEIIYAKSFTKEAGVTFSAVADGGLDGSKLKVARTKVTLGDADIQADDVTIADGDVGATVKTNRFNVESLTTVLPALVEYGASGQVQVDAKVRVTGGKAFATGGVDLAKISLSRPGQSGAFVSGLTGPVKLKGSAAEVGPLSFKLGSSPATLSANARSLSPLDSTYDFKADTLKVIELLPERKESESDQLNKFAARGSLAMANGGIRADTEASSASGVLSSVAYDALNVSASWADQRLTLRKLNLRALGGSIAAVGGIEMKSAPSFALTLDLDRIDIAKALESQASKSAGMLRGILTGRTEVSGRGSDFEELKPTLRGRGRMAVADAKLIGINIVAQALGKTKNIPGVGDLVPKSIAENHPALFSDPDTRIDTASLTFDLDGPRVTSRDLVVEAPDYRLTGDGWFDLDRQVDLKASILLSQGLSAEIQGVKKDIVYLTNKQGEVVVPLRITGTLPKVIVLPNVADLAQRAAQRAVERKGKETVEKFLKKKGLGGLLGGSRDDGSEGGAAPAPGSEATPSKDPLAPFLKKLF
jgi:uncharacterized protein involved in outer membrane biogenesis